MKRYECILWVLGAVLTLTIASNAQNSKCKCSDCSGDPSCSCCPSQTFTGTLEKEGNTYKFHEDSGKEWKIKNPEELSGHSGHVKLSGHVYSDDVIKVTGVNSSKDNSVNNEMKEKKQQK
jgi:hypothetical protein